MWVFLDDSGDCGVKFDAGSSRYLVLSACVFRTREAVEDAMARIERSRVHVAPDGTTFTSTREYKYSKTKRAHKDSFFHAIRDADFAVRTIFVDKRVIHSPHLRAHPRDMKAFLIMQLLTHTYGTVQNAKLVIDGQDTRAFGATDRGYFLGRVGLGSPPTIADVEFADSKRSPLVQLADMVAGAIHATLEGKPEARDDFETFGQRVWRANGGSHWQFK